MSRLLILIFIFSAFSAQGRMRTPAPLLPPRENASSPSAQSISENQKKSLRSQLTGLGVELGTVGVRNASSNDFAGLQLLFGFRANLLYPLGSRFFLKPSLGYFLKPESEGQVSVTQHLIEGGLGIQYALLMTRGVLWHAGVSQRLDYLFSKISIAGSSNMTPSAFRYRAGASTGLRIKLAQKSDLTFDFEAGVTPFDQFRLQSSFSSGIIFFID